MEEEGVVISVSDGMATVQMIEGAGCQGCASAGACKSGSEAKRTLEAVNKAGAAPGQCVVVDIESGAFLKASFIVYMVPVIFLFAGAYLGDVIARSVPGVMAAESWQAFGGVLFLALSILGVRLYDRKVKSSKGLRPVVVKIKEMP